MTFSRVLLTLTLVCATGLGAYTVTVRTRPASTTTSAEASASRALLDWLDASPKQRAELGTRDDQFSADLQRLRADVESRRSAFIATLETANATDEQIMADLEAALAANNALERRVARYLLSVRDHLTADQQRKLLGLCAREVRQHRHWRRGGGGPPANTPGEHQGQPQRGWRGGRGRGEP